MKRHITPILLNHRSARRYNPQVLVKALDKLTEEELTSLFAILKDGSEKKTSKHPLWKI